MTGRPAVSGAGACPGTLPLQHDPTRPAPRSFRVNPLDLTSREIAASRPAKPLPCAA